MYWIVFYNYKNVLKIIWLYIGRHYIKYDIKNVIITRGEKGILLVNNNEIFECKTKVREVYDVSGAGDTVIATFAYSLSKGISIRDSLNISNECAGYVITLPGTTPISRSDYSKIKKNIIKN